MCYGNHFGMHGGHGHSDRRTGGFGGRWAQGGNPWAQGPWARGGWFQPPANIQELQDRYELHLAAPGRNKSDFQLSVQDGVLTVACRNKQEESDLATQQNWIRQEFRTMNFERQFQLNEKIDAEGITASYTNGVLVVTLPKLASAQSQAKDVFVA
ncbi:MAG: Hsp20/alpha crystallin family protein [Saprospiraceae bacterium]|nr:Hsp20/alpha crystallin family protein [Saprospiraceae bacterium]